MVTKKELKDWLAENKRREYAKKLENFIDGMIKANALKGEMTFYISTGRYTSDGSIKTDFYDLWNTEDLSKENRKIVHENIVNKYKEFGFDIEKSSVDCGWSNHYFALKFNNIDKLIN